jgi:erythromycin esterase
MKLFILAGCLASAFACNPAASPQGPISPQVSRSQPVTVGDRSPPSVVSSVTERKQGSNDLGFEAWSDTHPNGWEKVGEGDLKHDGTSRLGQVPSLHIAIVPDGSPLGLKKVRPSTGFVGHRWGVTVWVKCLSEQPALPALIIGASGEFGETTARAVAHPGKSENGWTQLTSVLDVPQDASSIQVGALMIQPGECFVADMAETVDVIPVRQATAVHGVVVGANGAPVQGALVAAFHGEELIATTTTSDNGQFGFSLVGGVYEFSASATGGFAQTDEPLDVSAAGEIGLKMQTLESLVHIRGTLSGTRGQKALQPVVVGTGSNDTYARVVALPSANGEFDVWMPPARYYWAFGESAVGRKLREDKGSLVELRLTPVGPPDTTARQWIVQHSLTVGGVVPEAPAREAFRSLFKGTSVVAVGEATHGSTEFFALKQKILRYLVEEQGFRTLALEASGHDCDLAQRYIERGEGDAASAISALTIWPWKTMEMLSMLKWMREWNASHDSSTRIGLVCIDVQSSVTSFLALQEYLQCAEPQKSVELLKPVEELGPQGRGSNYEHDTSARRRVWRGLRALRSLFSQRGRQWSATCGRDRLVVAKHELRSLEQAHGARLDMASVHEVADGWVSRDQSMADNVVEATKGAGGGHGVMVWAHNLHVSSTAEGYHSMGHFLRRALGRKVVLVGTSFDRGAFQAIDEQPETISGWLRRFEVPSLGAQSLGGALGDVAFELKLGALALDLRLPMPKAASEWLSTPRPTWEVGSGYVSQTAITQWEPVTDRFDVILFVASVNRSIPLH